MLEIFYPDEYHSSTYKIDFQSFYDRSEEHTSELQSPS